MRIQPETSATSIVLIGNFNPVIFHPDWFKRMEILPEDLVDAAEIVVIHPEITSFRADWLELKVEQGSFSVTTSEAPWIRLSDLVVRTFKEFLSHTPIKKMGINREIHFSTPSEEVRNAVGARLAPHEPWGEWAEHIEKRDGKIHGGMRTLVMEQSVRDDGLPGYIRTKVEPSNRITNGIFMQVNDHYQVENLEDPIGSGELIDNLESSFERSITRSEWIADQVMHLVETEQG